MMNRYLYFIFLGLLCIACQGKNAEKEIHRKTVVETSSTKTNIALNQITIIGGKIIDFGKIRPEDTLLTREVQIINRSAQLLEIYNVNTACDCTSTHYTKKTVPTDTARIKIALNLKKISLKRPFKRYVTLFMNTQPEAINLILKGQKM